MDICQGLKFRQTSIPSGNYIKLSVSKILHFSLKSLALKHGGMNSLSIQSPLGGNDEL